MAPARWNWRLLPAVEDVVPVDFVGLPLFGAVGALFGAIPSLVQVPEKATSFSPVREQAALTVAVGARSAVGLMADSAGVGASSAAPVLAPVRATNDAS